VTTPLVGCSLDCLEAAQFVAEVRRGKGSPEVKVRTRSAAASRNRPLRRRTAVTTGILEVGLKTVLSVAFWGPRADALGWLVRAFRLLRGPCVPGLTTVISPHASPSTAYADRHELGGIWRQRHRPWTCFRAVVAQLRAMPRKRGIRMERPWQQRSEVTVLGLRCRAPRRACWRGQFGL